MGVVAVALDLDLARLLAGDLAVDREDLLVVVDGAAVVAIEEAGDDLGLGVGVADRDADDLVAGVDLVDAALEVLGALGLEVGAEERALAAVDVGDGVEREAGQALALELPSGLAAVPVNPGIIDTAMLRSCFGDSAAHYPDAEEWAKTAVPYLASLGPRDNGKALTCPGQ